MEDILLSDIQCRIGVGRAHMTFYDYIFQMMFDSGKHLCSHFHLLLLYHDMFTYI